MTLLLKKIRMLSAINVATFPMNEEEYELFFKAASDYIMSQGRNAWIMPFPQTTIKIKPKEMASVPYITIDISYLKGNIS